MSLASSKQKKNRTAIKPAYEDGGQPKHVSVIVVTAVAAGVCLFPLVSYFLKRGRGRTPSSNDGSTPSGRLPAPQRRQQGQPVTLADLRAIRAKAAESRCAGDSPENLSRSKSTLTPLGQAIMVARKVDVVEKKTLSALKRVKSDDSNPPETKEIAMLLEELTQVQLELDSVKGEENVRPLKKSQTQRIQRLIQRLESLLIEGPEESPTEEAVTEVTETSSGES